jgi:FKBP-type peptidyl-prolyl cis-trans isomerase FkpA
MSSLSRNEYIGFTLAVIIGIAVFAFGLVSVTGSSDDTSSTESQNTMTNDTTTPTNVTVQTTASGLGIADTRLGTGDEAVPGKAVFVHYTGMLDDGTVFDSNKSSDQPFGFILGQGMVIAGWEEGVQGMKVGGTRRLVIPADLAYGARGVTAPDGTVVIPANATLTFDVELVAVQNVQ